MFVCWIFTITQFFINLNINKIVQFKSTHNEVNENWKLL